MKNYKRSNYAANKSSENIVYKSEVSDDVDITLEDFLASNSSLTEADYEYWKNWSDKEYRGDELQMRRTSKKDVSIENLDEYYTPIKTTLEEEFEEKLYENLIKKALKSALKKLYSDKRFTERMRERFEKYYFYNMSTCQIAKEEMINSKTVAESINSAIKKLKKYFIEEMNE